MTGLRIGHGYDVHRLVEGRPLILGGVTVPYERGLLGHSDADVLAHAVMDALLGAAALGDIGGMFPDSDERWRGADSLLLLAQVTARLGYRQRGRHGAGAGAQAGVLRPGDAPAAGGSHGHRSGAGVGEGHHGGASGLHRRGGGHGLPRRGAADGGITG